MSDLDTSGRNKIGRNVLTSWLSHVVFIAFGFILPRVIDEKLGQASLGIWDFGWSIVTYLSLAMMGISSSVNRYVARYRASNEALKLSRTISSVAALQLLIAFGVTVSAVFLAMFLPDWMADKLGNQRDVTSHVILFLGLALAVQMAFDIYRGILTGCHEWSAYNALNAGGYAVSATAMLVVLALGGGLPGMAVTYFLVTVVTELWRRKLAREVCPEISLQREYVNAGDMKKVFRFGIKTVLLYLPRMIVQQVVMVLVVVKLGPAMLAVLARPLALAGHVTVLANKFGFVLTPTAGSLQGDGRSGELRSFSISHMRTGWILALLPLTFLFVLGDRLVALWMGHDYANWPVIAILSAGAVLPVAQSATLNILVGMNEHGKVAKWNLYASAGVILAGIAAVSLAEWTLVAAACLIALPSFFGGLITMLVGCRVLGISLREYCVDVIRDPLMIGCACALALWLVREYGPGSALLSLLAGGAAHALVAAALLRNDLRNAYATL